ncbi:Uncharacterised protein [Mycobacterium tuberculosis]|nr:Uncharacterised protein [Mycobacterium tuberculosis]
MPTTSPATPADASTPAPIARTLGKVNSAAPTATIVSTTAAIRRSSSIWVRARRARRLRSPSMCISRSSGGSLSA